MNKQAVKLIPAFKDYLWGGTKLKEKYNKKSDMEIMAESWELSTHKDGQSIVENGEFKGLTLSQYVEKNKGCIGENAEKFSYFPILIKFIDAKGSLSIQVHPDDEYAKRVEKEFGKTEMWYILECEENSFLYYGVNREISKDEFKERIKNNTVTEVLNAVPVHKGDVFFIEAGTIHAIGAGIVICEIQQNSNSTYRVYDFDRRDKNGNPRELHIDKAIDVSKLTPSNELNQPDVNSEDVCLASCDKFTVNRLIVKDEKKASLTEKSFMSIIAVDGSGAFCLNGESYGIQKGDSYFVPAQNGEITFTGDCTLILSKV